MNVKSLFSKENLPTGLFSWKAIALVTVAVASIFAILPQKTDVSRAESCNPVYNQPVFNPYPVTYQDPPEDCKDYALVQGRLSTGSYPNSQQQADAGVTARAGQEVYVLVYFHNGASENSDPNQTTIRDFKITTNVDTSVGTSHTVGATLSGSNVASKSGSMQIHTAANEKLEIVPGSGILYDYQTNPVQGGFDVGNNVLTMQDLRGCFAFSGFVRFTVRVVSTTTLSDNAVCINPSTLPATMPGQAFSGSVTLQNTGTTTWSNNDRYVLRVTGGSQVGLPDQFAIPHATTIPPGGSRTFNFNGTAPQTSGTYNFSFQMVRDNVVFGSVCPFTLTVGTPANVTLTIDKTVRNVTDNGGFGNSTNANPGETVEYKIVVNAHGGTATNLIVTDNFPSGLTYVNGSLTVNGQPHAPGLTSGINFGSLNDLQSLTIVFRAIVNQTSGSIVNTATARADNAAQVQDQATVNVTPVASVVCTPANQTVNVNQPATFAASGGNGQFTWSAPGGNPNSGNGSSFSTSYSTSGSKSVTVTSNGQSATCNVQVIHIDPVVNCAPANQTANVNQAVHFSATGGNGQYTWSAPNGSPATGNGSTFSTSYNRPGNYTVTVASSGRSDTCNVTINQVFNPVVCAPANQTANVNQTVNFTAFEGNGQYTWSAPSGSPSTGNGQFFSTRYANPGTYTVTVSSNGRSDTCAVVINQVFNPVVCAPANQSADVNQVVYFTASEGNGQYTWSAPNGSPSTGSGSSFNTRYNRSGTYTVTVSSNGRSDTCQVIVRDIPTPNVVCAPNRQDIDVNQTAYFSATGGNGSYTWSAPSGNPSSGSGTSFSTRYGNSGTYTVTVRSGDKSDTCTVIVRQVIPNNVVCNPSFQTVNVNQTAYFSATGGNGQFTWTANNGSPSTGSGSSFNTRYANPGTYTVNVSSDGRTDSCTVQVNQIVVTNPVVCNPNFQAVNVNQTAYFSATGGNGSYSWQAPDGNPSFGSGSSFSTSYSTAGSRFVTVNSGGSSANCSVSVSGVQGTTSSLSYLKKAWNDTKNQDATAVRASLGDTITYTLTVNNTGNGASTNFVISDDLSLVLDKADIIDNGGGTVSGSIITFPGVTIPAGGSVTKSFRVKVKTSLASGQTYTMTNTYGNTVNIVIGSPSVLGSFTAPQTGAAGVSAVTFAGLVTLGFVAYRKRKFLSQLILN